MKFFLFKVVLPVIVICLVVAAALAFYWNRSWGHRLSFGLDISRDEQLAALFQDHRAAFEKLQQMAADDVAHGWYLGASETNKIDESRRQEYQQLTSEIHSGLDVGMDGYGGGMRFNFAGGGTSAVGPDWAKGIEYVPGAHEANGAIYGNEKMNGTNYQQWQGVVSTNLDNAQALPTSVYLRPIETNWFIFYQRTD